ncbi:MAG: DUF423 domain-containing protein [Flavobacteriia bacterium]|jgi:uncharacterized membrane protein YgdD (TMEM256/DUF423 family)
MTKFQKNAFILGTFLLLTGIILGAFGAHGLEGKIPEKSIDSFKVGVNYQMYHGFAFLILGLIFPFTTFSMKWILRFMLLGVICFSGSIYGLALQHLIGLNISKILGPITPIGGLFLILSWAFLLVNFIRQKI